MDGRSYRQLTEPHFISLLYEKHNFNLAHWIISPRNVMRGRRGLCPGADPEEFKFPGGLNWLNRVQEKKPKKPDEKAKKSADELRHIVRILNTDLAGKRQVHMALTGIKGVGGDERPASSPPRRAWILCHAGTAS